MISTDSSPRNVRRKRTIRQRNRPVDDSDDLINISQEVPATTARKADQTGDEIENIRDKKQTNNNDDDDDDDNYEKPEKSAQNVSITGSEKENNSPSEKPTTILSPVANTTARPTLIPLDSNALPLNPPSTPIQPMELLPIRSPTRSPVRSPFKSPMAAGRFEKEESPMNHEPRLVITRLELTNFKSYAGKQVIGPFNASFSAVVGPNGSGKSNVIDSMLFVFGFRATKMRQAKLSELIHNSEQHPNLDSCSVDIFFQNARDIDEEKSELIPDTELVVSRKAFRNNASKYYINGKESNYTIVTEMLKEKGIDLDHKRFLILQGEVESIAQMKPKAEKDSDDGLLEYLEDIIGTSDYKAKIQTCSEQIETLNEVCVEKKNRYELVAKEKDSLEDKKEEAVKFLKAERKLLEKKSIAFQIEVIQDKTKLETAIKEVALLQKQLEEGSSDCKNHEKEMVILQKELLEAKKSTEILNQEIKALDSKQKALEREKITYDEKVKHLETKKKKSEKALGSASQALKESSAKLETHTKEQEEFEDKLKAASEELEHERAVLNKMKAELAVKTSTFSKQIEELKEKLQPWNIKLDNKHGEIEVAQSQIQMLQQKKAQAHEEIDNAKLKVKQIIENGQQKEQEKSSRQQELEHVTEQITLGEEDVSQASSKLKEMKDKLSNYRNKVNDAKNTVSTAQNKSKVLTGLMRLQKTGRIQGFYGRLGDLGTIDNKFDVAISTACPALDNMIVETVEVGQQCIEYLRKNQLGFGNFTILTKLSNFNLNPIQTPNNVPRLFDLVKPKDPKFAPAFYSVMRDTLVARDMNEARQVAYGKRRWRVVTLDGKLIDTSGTLSGGGNHVSRGAMSSRPTSDISEEDVQQMIDELAEKEKRVKIAEDTYYEMVNALSTLKNRKPQLEMKISTLQMDIDALAGEMKSAKANYKELVRSQEQADTSKMDTDIASTEKVVSRLQREYDEIKLQAKKIEEEIEALNEKIMEVGGVELRLQNSKVDSVKSQIELINTKRDQDIVSIKKLQSEINRYTKTVKQNERDIVETDKELEKIQNAYKSKNSSVGLENEINEKIATRDANADLLEKISMDLESKQQQVDEFKSVEIEITNKIEKYDHMIKACQRNISSIGEEFTSIEARDVNSLLGWLDDDSELRKELTATIGEELTEEQLAHFDADELRKEIESLESFMDECKVDVDILIDYTRRFNEFSERKSDLNVAVEERETIEKDYESLKKRRLDEFMEGFNQISLTLKEMYQMITMGGNAELELVDSLDPFSEGILFSVMPPKKSWRNISNLSGGEKTLSSLALVFALHRYKPTPLYVMDEIDAALDFRNVSIVANYIKESTKNAQFIVISLRNNMFELAKQLVGIYKVNNMTRSISLQNKDLLGNEQQK